MKKINSPILTALWAQVYHQEPNLKDFRYLAEQAFSFFLTAYLCDAEFYVLA